MAIFSLETKAVSRANGSSAVASAAYRSGTEMVDERTGQVFDYTRKGGILSAEIFTPEGMPVPERETLWNAAEAAERRKDSRVAREWRPALPAELSREQQIALANEYGKAIAERFGVAVDVCVHAPDKGGDERNFHAHILTTTRQFGPDGKLGAKASIEIGNKDRAAAGFAGTQQDDIREMRALWAEMANDALERSGHGVRIDHRSYADQGIDLTPTTHVGVHATAMHRKGKETERVDINADVREENAEKIEANPSLVLEKITQTQAVFDRRDIARELNRYIDDPEQFQNLMARIESAPELVQLAPETMEGRRTIPARLSTREMIDAEQRMVDAADGLAGAGSHTVKPDHVAAAIGKRESLSEEQRAAVSHVTGAGQLAVIIGDAGTGKSFAMATAKEAWEAQGFRVRGCALSGKAADELQAGSGIESRTIHSLEHGWKRGKNPLTSRDVLVVDEAGMVGSRQLGRVLEAAQKAGAKVVLLGDDKQLAAIEAGAGFRAITERVGAAEITQIRRQRDGWAREASREFARGDVAAGLDAYNERGGVRLVGTREQAKAALAADWLADRQKGGSSIILAHSNKDVQSLNETIRTARRDAGELGEGIVFDAERGRREFAAGDRIVFLKNDAALAVKNGSLGTIQQTEPGRLSVALDDGRLVAFDQAAYANVDHGYAVTIHKSQGVTVDRAHVLATPGMDRSLAYVGMTRHRDSATLYAGQDDFGSYDKLARGIARQRPKESTLDFADRRGFDGEGVVRAWIERGRAKIEKLGQRAQAALGAALERAGVRSPAPSLDDVAARPGALADLRERPRAAQEKPRGFGMPSSRANLADLVGEPAAPSITHPATEAPSPEDARAAKRAEIAARMAGEARAPDPLAVYRKSIDAARASGDSMEIGMAERQLDLATQAQAAGRNPAHEVAKIKAQSQREAIDHMRTGGNPAELASAMRQAPTLRGEPAPRIEQPKPATELDPRDAKKAEIRAKLQKSRERDRGGHGY